jgi:hypothetical protein
MQYLVIYSPFGAGLPTDQLIESPALTYMTTTKTGDTLKAWLIYPGANLFPLDIPQSIRQWLKQLKEADPNISIHKTKATQLLAKEFEPQLAIQVIRGLCGGIDDFLSDCTTPEVVRAATARKKQLERLGALK